jgi:cbb3-type cytochrome oxidase maturation protein
VFLNPIAMEVIPLLIGVGMLVAGGFLGAFLWALKSGQFDDTVTPGMRIPEDEIPER